MSHGSWVPSLLVCVAVASPLASAGGDGAHGHDAHGHGGFMSRPDSYAPIGVMGSHMHEQGDVMLSFRWGRMRMDGNRDGSDRQSASEVLEDFAITPTDMDMDVYMFGLMLAPTDWLTLMLGMPLLQKGMDHLTGPMTPAPGTKFRTETFNVGDLRLTGLLRLWENEMHHVHLDLGVGFPTGRVRLQDATPLGPHTTLPFPMQIGSGTFDLVPGVTYFGHARHLSWGAQVLGTVRLDDNKAGWAASDGVDTTAWLAVPLTSWVSVSGRLAYHWWSNYRGDEPRPPSPMMIPTADPNRRAGQLIELLPGINFYLPLGPLGKHRFGFEAGFPVYQYLDGPQLETDWRIILGWQKAFGPLFGG